MPMIAYLFVLMKLTEVANPDLGGGGGGGGGCCSGMPMYAVTAKKLIKQVDLTCNGLINPWRTRVSSSLRGQFIDVQVSLNDH